MPLVGPTAGGAAPTVTPFASVNTYADARALGAGAYPVVEVLGGSTLGDGQDGVFYWNASSVAADDGFAVLAPSSGGTGRLIRIYGAFLQSGTGAVARPLQEKIRGLQISPMDLGAAGDNSTDDAAAIQRAIDVAGSVSGRRSGVEVVIDRKYAIGSTINIQQKSIRFRGLGWGQEGAAAPNSYLRWIGAAGSPMLRIQDVQGGVRVSDLRFIGNPTNKPSAAISLYQTTAFANSFHLFENINIGDSLAGEASAGTQFTDGILIEGSSNQNNAESLWQNLKINGCSGKGIRATGIQMGEHVFVRATIASCQYGIAIPTKAYFFGLGVSNSSAADFLLSNTDDFANPAVARIHVRGFFSEGSSRLAEMTSNGRLVIEDGSYQYGSSTNADGKYIKAENNGTQMVMLRNFRYLQASAPTTTPFISMKSSGGGAGKRELILDGVEGFPLGGPNSNGVDITTQDPTDGHYVYFKELLSNSGANSSAHRVGHQFVLGFTGINFDPSRNDICGNTTSPGRQAVSPTQITGDQNDYNPSNAGMWRLSSDAARNITGIARTFPGRELKIINVGSFNITLQNQNALSTTTNRIITGTGADVVLAPDDTAELWYDWTTGRWRILNTY